MRRILLLHAKAQSSKQDFLVPEEEAHHIRKVLRLESGELVEIIDGDGNHAHASLVYEGKNQVRVQLKNEWISAPERHAIPLTLEIACLKGEAFEWVLEKATEVGVKTLVPFVSAHTVTQFQRRGADAFQEKWQKISDQALKQCGRSERMTIEAPRYFTDLDWSLDRILFDEKNEGSPDLFFSFLKDPEFLRKNNRLMVGPEGGFSELERAHFLRAKNCTMMSLGKTILRAETAAIVACGAFKLAMPW